MLTPEQIKAVEKGLSVNSTDRELIAIVLSDEFSQVEDAFNTVHSLAVYLYGGGSVADED